jgi:hypothetical protein
VVPFSKNDNFMIVFNFFVLFALIVPFHRVRMFRSYPSFISKVTPHLRKSSFRTFSTVEETRPVSNGFIFDVNFLTNNGELVKSHLLARHASEDTLRSIDSIPELKKQRSDLITRGDKARNQRKTLSKQIGLAIGKKAGEEAEKLKAEVETATKAAEVVDEELALVEKKIEAIFSVLPNLLDDR